MGKSSSKDVIGRQRCPLTSQLLADPQQKQRLLFSNSKGPGSPRAAPKEEDCLGSSVMVLQAIRAPKNATISTIRAMEGCGTVLSPVRRSTRHMGKNMDLSDKKTSILKQLEVGPLNCWSKSW
jgi:hypothetical protein